VEASCDRAIVLDRGRIKASGSLAELGREASATTLELIVRTNAERLSAALEGLPAGAKALVRRQTITPSAAANDVAETLQCAVLELIQGASAETLAEALAPVLVAAEVPILSLVPKKASLEEIFVSLTEPAEASAP
jgi:ABC-type multidrug transport system ATPase subunit